MRQARFLGYVRECAVAVIAKEIAGGLFTPAVVERRAIDQKDIEPAIVVVIEKRDATAHLFEQKLLPLDRSRDVLSAGQASLNGYVFEYDSRCRLNMRRRRER